MRAFLDKYDTVIFDMDGVITSEQAYWDAAALTVYEYYGSGGHFGECDISPRWAERNVKEIRRRVFFDDKIISLLKGKGVNSNWDLGYTVVLISLIINSENAEEIYRYARGLSDNIIDEYDNLANLAKERTGENYEKFRRNGELWQNMQNCFQEWYLGDEEYCSAYNREPKLKGKTGLASSEEPIIDLSDIKRLICELSKTKRLCTGTGRVYREIAPTLDRWGILDYFASEGISNYDHVAAAEKEFGITLTKPHPYMFLKAMCGTDYSDSKILAGDYDKGKIPKTLIVGDAGADILAAKAMGADFCAVLTGINGQKARGYFEELKSDYILNSVKDMMEDK